MSIAIGQVGSSPLEPSLRPRARNTLASSGMRRRYAQLAGDLIEGQSKAAKALYRDKSILAEVGGGVCAQLLHQVEFAPRQALAAGRIPSISSHECSNWPTVNSRGAGHPRRSAG